MLYGRREGYAIAVCCIFFCLITGCRHYPHIPLSANELYLTSLTYDSPLDWITRCGHAPESYVADERFRILYRGLGRDEEEIKISMGDYFVRQPLKTFHFGSVLPGDKLALRIQTFFHETGWRINRHGYLIENVNCQNWLRVFEKGEAQVHVLITGKWAEEIKSKECGVLYSQVDFKFHNCSPRSFFPVEVSNLLDSYYTDWESPVGAVMEKPK